MVFEFVSRRECQLCWSRWVKIEMRISAGMVAREGEGDIADFRRRERREEVTDFIEDEVEFRRLLIIWGPDFTRLGIVGGMSERMVCCWREVGMNCVSSLEMQIFVSETDCNDGMAMVSLGRLGAFPSI